MVFDSLWCVVTYRITVICAVRCPRRFRVTVTRSAVFQLFQLFHLGVQVSRSRAFSRRTERLGHRVFTVYTGWFRGWYRAVSRVVSRRYRAGIEVRGSSGYRGYRRFRGSFAGFRRFRGVRTARYRKVSRRYRKVSQVILYGKHPIP